jgi:hypothetical protein
MEDCLPLGHGDGTEDMKDGDGDSTWRYRSELQERSVEDRKNKI